MRWSPRRIWSLLAFVLIVASAAGGWWWQFGREPETPVKELLHQARLALISEDYAAVEAYCRRVFEREPESVPAHLIAGEAAMKQERFEDALSHFHAIPRDGSEDSVRALLSAAEVARALGRLGAAERDYRAVLKHRPDHVNVHERLAFILDLQGRRYEATPHLYALLRHDRISYSTMIRLGTRDSAISYPDEVEKARQAGHDPARVNLAEAVAALARHEPEKAEPLLRQAIQQDPQLVEAHARLGHLLADRNMSLVPRWQRKLPEAAESHPDIWIVRGQWCRRAGQSRAAVRCFWEAARRDPNVRIAYYQLSQLLPEPKFAETRAACATRARQLQDLAVAVNRLTLDRNDVSAMKDASKVLEQLGRYWEAYGWCGMVLVTDPAHPSTRRRMRTLQRRLSPKLPATDPAADPLAGVDLSKFPRPRWPVASTGPKPEHAGKKSKSRLRFVDRAAEAGLRFTYFNSHDPQKVGTRMHEFSGGGIGVIDYDRDGRPDVYLTQGCPWPPKTESTEYRDRLFRNLGNGRFEDVTEQAGLGDGWFSQGVAVGDLDGDGWPDIYLANIGRNRLYRNNGDGTFSDVSADAGLTGTQWTTSCLIADLNGDGCPDLYDVNYLKGDDLFDRLCLIEGRRRACVPGVFPAERDRILINGRDGTFAELTGKRSAPLDPARAGLGIVAADFDGSGRLGLFVANDVVANAFLANETAKAGGELKIQEKALLAGLAFDRDGRAQACMGVAAGDVDGNGLLDLYVTNYYNEANSLYLQTAPGLFTESSRQAGLHQPSFRQLGFGTQFLDADLDGWLDLVVSNGHLDDFRYMKIPYRMPAQFFRNSGSGRFEEVAAPSLGEYFQRKLLGRSLAVLDWNRDGRPDFAVSHLESPAALVTNVSQETGHWLKLRLYGVESPRDAIGATVTLRRGKQTWTQHLTAGSGYQASNERMLLFGLGGETRIDRMTIKWPSGTEQVFNDLPADREWAVVENRPVPLELPPEK